ncbi:S-adenosyl-L-methionine-dependent methyltransferase [Jimgerdemannia flammicorona]|uniref:S-adenosyl-L-methionine-dependent methyltransferase n=1 Tax=Jimgerdemannia flammicorona TaxID=994334 RepID=A0A433Q238_9FUNG|nr:S-adenosyl-L-methionine-dependent methyltransferase [Jimgerdemannia flammicorona]
MSLSFTDPQPILGPATANLYTKYVRITDETELRAHILRVRAILDNNPCDYRCIKEFRFAQPRLLERPIYSIILSQRLSDPSTPRPLLDIGCCTGTDLRQLVVDGYPASELVGIDQYALFVDAGYELFRDRKTCGVRFVIGNALEEGFPRGTRLEGERFEVVHAGSVVHLLDRKQIRNFVKGVRELVRPGGWFVGGHMGASETKDFVEVSGLRHLEAPAEFKRILEEEGFVEVVVNAENRGVREGVHTMWVDFVAKVQ